LMFLQKVSKSMQFMKVTFQKAGNLHMKRDLHGSGRQPAPNRIGHQRGTI
jgi:hypothetical protein